MNWDLKLKLKKVGDFIIDYKQIICYDSSMRFRPRGAIFLWSIFLKTGGNNNERKF